jgi:hypothetical protein
VPRELVRWAGLIGLAKLLGRFWWVLWPQNVNHFILRKLLPFWIYKNKQHSHSSYLLEVVLTRFESNIRNINHE